jgi:hypothetical protein
LSPGNNQTIILLLRLSGCATPNEKGTTVRPIEHSVKFASTSKTDLFALLRYLLRGRGRTAPSGRLAVILVIAAAVAGSLLVSASAFAASLPQITNFRIAGSPAAYLLPTSVVLFGSIENGDDIHWHLEDITKRGFEEGKSWTPGPESKEECSEAKGSCTLDARVRHLNPGTVYVARLSAENEVGQAKPAFFEFTTKPIAAPGIGTITASEIENKGGAGVELGATYATFRTSELIENIGAESFVPAGVESNGAETKYRFEYAESEAGNPPPEGSPSWKPFTSGEVSGTISVAEDFANPKAKLTGLTPATKYYLRLVAENSIGKAIKVQPFETTPLTPSAGAPQLIGGELSATSASVSAAIFSRGFKTEYRFEYAESEGGHAPAQASPLWESVPGGEGAVAAVAPSEVFASEEELSATATLVGLSPATVYYTRVHVESEPEGHREEGTSQPSEAFSTFGPPTATTFPVHALDGESLRVLGAVSPNVEKVNELQSLRIGGSPTGGTFTLSFEGQTTAPIPFNASNETVGNALAALPALGKGNISVGEGMRGLPYLVKFDGTRGGADQPQITADASGLTPSGTVTVTTLQKGASFTTHYHFQYVSEADFNHDNEGFSSPDTHSTPEVVGSGGLLGTDLPTSSPGETYDFRIVATNDTSGNPVVDGATETLTGPIPALVEPQPPCPNQAARAGLSAKLPDCRAYEQVTPVNKGGTLEPFNIGVNAPAAATASVDGEHFELESPYAKFGASPDGGEGPYFFSRTSSGWQMTSGAPAAEAGVDNYLAEVFNPDLTLFAFSAEFQTGPDENEESPDVEFKAGPPGGPYTLVASVPRKQSTSGTEHVGWVAASETFSKLILQLHDPSLAGHPSGTVGGTDLYEYSEGKLRQVNVTGPSPGTTIGTCGAVVVHGHAEEFVDYASVARPIPVSSAHALSVDGSRVFFEATPGSDCAEAKHVYVRVDGTETVDLGVYTFAAANAQGSEVLLEKKTGENPGLYLYSADSGTAEFLPSTGVAIGAEDFMISEDFNVVYIQVGQSVDRYDISTHTLSPLLAPVGPIDYVSPEGRYAYFGIGGVTRYDSAENVIDCIICASPFNPSPRYGISNFGGAYNESGGLDGTYSDAFNGVPKRVYDSADGDFAFFATRSALLPGDLNGEGGPEGNSEPSVDVYEWRNDGIDGCVHLQGCLALITPGTDGGAVALFGTDASGRDVFFVTKSQLLPSDNDTSEDIYDARIDGGFPEAARPVECEGDSCSTPFAAPNDLTPSSAAFQGAGDVLGAVLPEVKPKLKAKPKKKRRSKKKKAKRKDAKGLHGGSGRARKAKDQRRAK